MKARLALLAAAAASLVLVRAAAAGGPALSVGVVDDAVEQPTLAATKEKIGLVRRAGFDTIGVTQPWTLGEAAPPAGEVTALQNVFAAARSLGMHVILGVYPAGSLSPGATGLG